MAAQLSFWGAHRDRELEADELIIFNHSLTDGRSREIARALFYAKI